MEYETFIKFVNERIKKGKIFGKIQYPPTNKPNWRNYILFLQPSVMRRNKSHNFSPLFSVLLDGEGRTHEEEFIRGGLGLSGIMRIDDFTIEDYIDFKKCLKNKGLIYNRKTNTVEKYAI